MWSIDLPLSLDVGAKKPVALNLNIYRNLHPHINNKAKIAFKEKVKPLLEGIPLQEKIHLHYELFAPTKARRDLMNVTSVVDKFFSDVLPEAGVILDDHAEIVVSTSSSFGGVDKLNPRVRVTIIPVDRPMTVGYT